MMRRLVTIVIALMSALQVMAQAVPFVTIRMDAGQQALGGAHVADASLLPIKETLFEAGIGKTLWQTDGIGYNLTNIEARVRIVESLAIGLEYTSNNMGEMNLYSDNGQPKGTFQPGEMCAGLILSYNPLGRLNIHAEGKMIRSSLTEANPAKGFAADVGVIYMISDSFRAGIAAENIGAALDYGYGAYPLPTTYKAGLSGAISISGKHGVLIAADAGAMPSTGAFLASVGAGYEYNKMISARFGAHICTKETALPTYFSAGIFFQSTIFDIGAAWLSAANTYSISARLKL